jgi:hypothetical protein
VYDHAHDLLGAITRVNVDHEAEPRLDRKIEARFRAFEVDLENLSPDLVLAAPGGESSLGVVPGNERKPVGSQEGPYLLLVHA